MEDRLQWDRDGLDWPHRARSRFVDAAGLRWHVQRFGTGAPVAAPGAAPGAASGAATLAKVLLVHGTGASTHSWRDVAPQLAIGADVLAMDLPGHAFTSLPAGGITSLQLSLPGMADALAQLLRTLDFAPDLVVGHSAGAAIAMRLCIDGRIAPRLLVSLNGAILPLGGVAGQLFSPVARLMAITPFVPRLFAWRAGDSAVLQRLMDSTGSRIDASGMALYRRLASNAGHAQGALGMMANWDLHAFERDLPRLRTRTLLVVGTRDTTVPPTESDKALALLGGHAPVELVRLEGLGHLAHEERPDTVVNLIRDRFAAL
ncbi:MAG: alpha/beta fold hydrolase BchO [Burkholderiaceae bacterium]